MMRESSGDESRAIKAGGVVNCEEREGRGSSGCLLRESDCYSIGEWGRESDVVLKSFVVLGGY